MLFWSSFVFVWSFDKDQPNWRRFGKHFLCDHLYSTVFYVYVAHCPLTINNGLGKHGMNDERYELHCIGTSAPAGTPRYQGGSWSLTHVSVLYTQFHNQRSQYSGTSSESDTSNYYSYYVQYVGIGILGDSELGDWEYRHTLYVRTSYGRSPELPGGSNKWASHVCMTNKTTLYHGSVLLRTPVELVCRYCTFTTVWCVSMYSKQHAGIQ